MGQRPVAKRVRLICGGYVDPMWTQRQGGDLLFDGDLQPLGVQDNVDAGGEVGFVADEVQVGLDGLSAVDAVVGQDTMPAGRRSNAASRISR